MVCMYVCVCEIRIFQLAFVILKTGTLGRGEGGNFSFDLDWIGLDWIDLFLNLFFLQIIYYYYYK